MKNLNLFFIFVVALFSSCGERVVDYQNSNYQTKIAVEGFLISGSQAKNIKIMRNFPLNSIIDSNSLVIRTADAYITDNENAKTYNLTFNPVTKCYENNELIIQYGKKYSFSCSANIDGKILSATSETTTPKKGFAIDKELSKPDKLFYASQGGQKNLSFHITHSTSPGISFYAFSLLAIEPTMKNFIKDNLFNIDSTEKNIADHPERYNKALGFYEYDNSGNITVNTPIEWYNFYFYGKYRVIAYACDKNMKEYLFTYQNVIEMDGNLHEPLTSLKGDGIGVFGSCIADTMYIEVLKPNLSK